jgi:hypothetical protein
MNKYLLLVISYLCAICANSQDLILKTNGDTIMAKVMEVGLNAVSYKKFNYQDGPVFTESKSDIRFIRYANGDMQYFDKSTPAVKNDAAKKDSLSGMQSSSTSTTTPQQQQQQKVKIEHIDNKYTINGKPAKLKDVDRQLGTSKNPAILVPLKAAKAMGTANKISKITSYPTTITGGATFLVKGIDLWNDIQRGRTTSKSYTNALWSMLSTITLPITNKILKKKSDKMHDKLIDMYNVTN